MSRFTPSTDGGARETLLIPPDSHYNGSKNPAEQAKSELLLCHSLLHHWHTLLMLNPIMLSGITVVRMQSRDNLSNQ